MLFVSALFHLHQGYLPHPTRTIPYRPTVIPIETALSLLLQKRMHRCVFHRLLKLAACTLYPYLFRQTDRLFIRRQHIPCHWQLENTTIADGEHHDVTYPGFTYCELRCHQAAPREVKPPFTLHTPILDTPE